MFKLYLEKAEETRDQIASIHWIIEKLRKFQEKHLLLFHWLCWSLWQTGKFFTRWEYQTTWPHSWENMYAGQEATDRTGHGTTDWFQIGKGACQGCILYLAYLNYMQSTSWETLGWKKHKLESRLLGEVSITSDMQMTPPLWQRVKRNYKASWWKWKRRVKKLA